MSNSRYQNKNTDIITESKHNVRNTPYNIQLLWISFTNSQTHEHKRHVWKYIFANHHYKLTKTTWMTVSLPHMWIYDNIIDQLLFFFKVTATCRDNKLWHGSSNNATLTIKRLQNHKHSHEKHPTSFQSCSSIPGSPSFIYGKESHEIITEWNFTADQAPSISSGKVI